MRTHEVKLTDPKYEINPRTAVRRKGSGVSKRSRMKKKKVCLNKEVERGSMNMKTVLQTG